MSDIKATKYNEVFNFCLKNLKKNFIKSGNKLQKSCKTMVHFNSLMLTQPFPNANGATLLFF